MMLVHVKCFAKGHLDSSGWDLFFGSTLVGMYAKCRNMEDPWKMFIKRPSRNSITTKIVLLETPS
jgi:hypothetical protein